MSRFKGIVRPGETDRDGGMGHERVQASAIADDLLQSSGAAMMSGDFEAFSACFLLPTVLETEAGRRVLATERELRDVFDAVHTYFRRHGISDYVRRCIAAEYKAPDEITTSHESRLLNGTTLLADPFPAMSTLKRVDGVWKVVEARYTLIDQPWLQAAIDRGKDAG